MKGNGLYSEKHCSVHAEYQEHPSGDGSPTGEWVLTDAAEGSQLGTEERVKKKRDIILAGNSSLVGPFPPHL